MPYYVASRGQGKTIRLSTPKVRSVALMGIDQPVYREVQRRLDALVVQRGAEAIGARIEEYATDVPGLADWESRESLSLAGRTNLLGMRGSILSSRCLPQFVPVLAFGDRIAGR